MIFKNTETQETGQDFCFVLETVVFICVLFFFVPFILSIVYHWFGLGGRSRNQNRHVSLTVWKYRQQRFKITGSGVRADSPTAYVTRSSHTELGSGDRQTDRLEY